MLDVKEHGPRNKEVKEHIYYYIFGPFAVPTKFQNAEKGYIKQIHQAKNVYTEYTNQLMKNYQSINQFSENEQRSMNSINLPTTIWV